MTISNLDLILDLVAGDASYKRKSVFQNNEQLDAFPDSPGPNGIERRLIRVGPLQAVVS